MNAITSIKQILTSRLLPSMRSTPALGRWSLKYDEQVLQRVIDMANEDHCGCCVQVKPTHQHNGDTNAINNKKSNDNVNYYYPFII